jgi:hypothetical protein
LTYLSFIFHSINMTNPIQMTILRNENISISPNSCINSSLYRCSFEMLGSKYPSIRATYLRNTESLPTLLQKPHLHLHHIVFLKHQDRHLNVLHSQWAYTRQSLLFWLFKWWTLNAGNISHNTKMLCLIHQHSYFKFGSSRFDSQF